MKNTFIQCYNNKGRQILGSEYAYYVDGRQTLNTIQNDITVKSNNQKTAHSMNSSEYVPCHTSMVKIFRGERFNTNNLLREFTI